MRIGIDVDDVITNTSSAIKECIEKCDNNDNISNYMEEIMRGEIPNKEVEKFFDENIIEILKNCTIKEDASRVIQKWLDNKNEIFIITSRGEERFKGSEIETIEYLKENNINYTKIFFNSFDKAKICKENNIDVMIDDSAKHCSEIKKQNIEAILFTSEVNESLDVDLPRVKDWMELEEKIGMIQDKRSGFVYVQDDSHESR